MKGKRVMGMCPRAARVGSNRRSSAAGTDRELQTSPFLAKKRLRWRQSRGGRSFTPLAERGAGGTQRRREGQRARPLHVR